MTNYALWKVIVNGESPPPKRIVDGVEQTYPPTTAEEKLARKNELKARGTLLISLPNEHQLKFNSYKNDKSLMKAIEKRFGGNKESKKTQKTLLKQQYENFNGSSSEGFDQTYDRLQKLISQLEILEEMDLKWQMAILTIRSRRFLKKTERKVGANGFETIRFDKTKVECYNCHKRGHFVRECRAPKKNRNREPVRRNVTVETTDAKALVAQDEIGYDWNDQGEDGLTNFAFMAYTSSGYLSSSSLNFKVSTCSKACLKSYETLKEHYDNLSKDYKKSQLNVGSYKIGLESVEARLVVYKKNEDIFEENIKILKLDIHLRDNALTELRKKLEKAEKERDEIKITLENFENSSKTLNNMLDNEYVVSESVTSVPDIATNESKPKSVSVPLIEDWVSDSEDENKTETKSKQRKSSFAKLEFVKPNEQVKSPRESVKQEEHNRQAKHPRKNCQSPRASENSKINQKVNTVRAKHVNTARLKVNTARPKAVLNDVQGNQINAVKASASWVWRPKHKVLDHVSRKKCNPQLELQEKGVIDSGWSRHMTGNMSYLSEYEEIDGEYVAFGGDLKGGKIIGKGKITGKGKISTDTECVVLSPKFKLLDESQVLLRVPRKNNMYSVDLKNVAPSGGLTCLFAKATLDESNLWHRRLGHINFKTMNKLKGKQHKASCKTKTVSSISQPLQMLHMGLFGLTFVKSLMKKMYCLVVTDDFSRFSWVFFLATKDETSGILKAFITGIENLIDHKVKIIRCDNGTEFKNNKMNQFCDNKADEGFFVGYSVNSKAFTIFNSRTRIVEETLHITFLKNKPNIEGSKPNWLFDIDTLTKSMNYKPVVAGINLMVVQDSPGDGFKPSGEEEKKDTEGSGNKESEAPITKEPRVNQEKDSVNSTNRVNVVSLTVNAASNEVNVAGRKSSIKLPNDLNVPDLKDISIFKDSYEDVFGAEANLNNMKTTFQVSPILTTIIHKDHPVEQIIRDIHSAPQTRRMTVTDHGLQVTQKDDEIFISQDKYVNEILKKFGFSTMKTASTPVETSKPLMKDENTKDVDVHLYRSMIGSLMYLTSTRPDIMFVVCACARFQVTPKVSHLQAVKRIFRYLKGQPKLSLWYPKDSLFDLESYTDSDYVGASLDRKFTTGGCQFLGRRLILWQCKVVANSTTEAEYIAAANCCGQVLWIQNQMLDYGYNFMNTKIFIENESII
nr:uncharacterized mitochondrial protein AtMg00810-like [Tanacetum cinerariifolium]